MALKGTLGYLPEGSRLYETMTAEEYLAFFGEIYRDPKRGDHCPDQPGFSLRSLLKLAVRRLGEFSKGMKRKTAIARSLIHNPDFLVYDEPTSGLDLITSRFITEYLKKLKNEGRDCALGS